MPRALPQSCTLLVSTYNWEEALRVVLESVKKQTRVPDEVIVADDGSGPSTREMLAGLEKAFPCPLIHVWHEDRGFRKCIIWNKAISATRGEYIVQIDGDCILSASFIEDHLGFARRGWFSCGSRALCSRELTGKILSAGEGNRGKTARLGPFSRGVVNKFNAVRIPPLAKFLRARYKASRPYISKGCNMGFWRKDLLAVNGYNESISGWGREDAELEVRLIKSGVRRQALKFAACQYHLFHRENDRSRDEKNMGILLSALADPEFWTPHGIVKKRATPPSGFRAD